MSVKVGLATSSGAAAPRPCTMPLASVVLPPPTLPISSTTDLRGNSRAMHRPSAMVSSSECVWKMRGALTHGLRQIAQQVGGDKGLLAQFRGSKLTAAAVQPHRREHRRFEIIRRLRDQPGGQ